MATSALATKMKLKPDQHAAIIAAPADYIKELSPLPSGVVTSTNLKGKFDWIQLFVQSRSELEKLAPRVMKALKPESILWISFPKGSSNIQTDLTRDKGWESFQKSSLKWVTLISVNETWSAFAMRPYKPGESKQSFR
jgi:hypothetical protein